MAKKPLKIGLLESCAASSGKVHPALLSNFAYCLYKAAMQLRAKMDEALEPHGVFGAQFGALRLLKATKPVSQIELGRELGIDRASIVKMVDLLEAEGYVERKPSPSDRRVNLISVTAKGERLIEKATVLRDAVEQEFLRPLSNQEREQVKLIMPKLLR